MRGVALFTVGAATFLAGHPVEVGVEGGHVPKYVKGERGLAIEPEGRALRICRENWEIIMLADLYHDARIGS